jgi:hypothetical protein
VSELLVAEDAEKAALAALKTRLPDAGEATAIPASTSIPKTAPSEFFRVIVTGGGDRDMVTDQPTITVEAYARGEVRAERLAAKARAIFEACARDGDMGGVPCYRVDLFGRPQNLPNPQVPGWYRYTFSISADLRKTAV